MKEKGPGNSSVRPLSETRKKQMIILWVKKYYLCRVFFPKVPFGVFVLQQGTTLTDVYILAVGRDRQL